MFAVAGEAGKVRTQMRDAHREAGLDEIMKFSLMRRTMKVTKLAVKRGSVIQKKEENKTNNETQE